MKAGLWNYEKLGNMMNVSHELLQSIKQKEPL